MLGSDKYSVWKRERTPGDLDAKRKARNTRNMRAACDPTVILSGISNDATLPATIAKSNKFSGLEKYFLPNAVIFNAASRM